LFEETKKGKILDVTAFFQLNLLNLKKKKQRENKAKHRISFLRTIHFSNLIYAALKFDFIGKKEKWDLIWQN